MDRLTTHDPDRQLMVCRANYRSWNDIYDRLAAYEDTGLTPEEIDDFARQACEIRTAVGCKTLDDCCRLVEEGRLVVLSCKVGDTVYQIDAERVYESIVRRLIFDTNNIAFDERAIGKTVFLTREEAEAALIGGESNA